MSKSKYLNSNAVRTVAYPFSLKPGVRVIRVKVGEPLPERVAMRFEDKQVLVRISQGKPERSIASIMDVKQLTCRSS